MVFVACWHGCCAVLSTRTPQSKTDASHRLVIAMLPRMTLTDIPAPRTVLLAGTGPLASHGLDKVPALGQRRPPHGPAVPLTCSACLFLLPRLPPHTWLIPGPPQVHAKIRENPILPKKERKAPAEKKKWQPAKSTYEERKERLKAKLATIVAGDDE